MTSTKAGVNTSNTLLVVDNNFTSQKYDTQMYLKILIDEIKLKYTNLYRKT